MNRPVHSTGFTLAEAMIAVAILAMTISAITHPFVAAAQNDLADARMSVALCLAQEMIEEMIDKPFDDPDGGVALGADSGEMGREDFDNIDDYHGCVENSGAITYADGTAVTNPAAAGLSRYVTTEYAHVSGQDVGDPATFICVTVEVKYLDQSLVKLSRLIYALQ